MGRCVHARCAVFLFFFCGLAYSLLQLGFSLLKGYWAVKDAGDNMTEEEQARVIKVIQDCLGHREASSVGFFYGSKGGNSHWLNNEAVLGNTSTN